MKEETCRSYDIYSENLAHPRPNWVEVAGPREKVGDWALAQKSNFRKPNFSLFKLSELRQTHAKEPALFSQRPFSF